MENCNALACSTLSIIFLNIISYSQKILPQQLQVTSLILVRNNGKVHILLELVIEPVLLLFSLHPPHSFILVSLTPPLLYVHYSVRGKKIRQMPQRKKIRLYDTRISKLLKIIKARIKLIDTH